MSSIQEIHELETKIYDIVNDFCSGCTTEDTFTIDGEKYNFWNYVTNDGIELVPDNDKISDLANSILFLD